MYPYFTNFLPVETSVLTIYFMVSVLKPNVGCEELFSKKQEMEWK